MRNQIVAENARAGSEAWKLTNPAGAGEVEGYASTTSAAAGEGFTIHVSSTAPRFRGWLYRLGWYGGLGGRELAALPVQDTIAQPAPTMDERGMVRCAWSPAYTLTVEPEWVSGLYLVRLQTEYDDPARVPEDSYVTFVVRDDTRTGHIVLQTAVATYQAYNTWGGKSTYVDVATGEYADRARAVSYDRPYGDGVGSGQVLFWDYSLVRWLEGSGYDVSYATNLDLDRGDPGLMQAGVIISGGHDEYWSQAMRDHAEQALASGTSLMFLGSNAVYWRVRFEDDGRVMVCYKDAGPLSFDPMVDPAATTRLYRDPIVGQPEQALVGQMYNTWNSLPNFSLRVTNTHLWPFAGTGLRDGDELGGLVGYEMDQVFEGQDNVSPVILAESPILGADGQPYVSHVTLYRRGTAWVFASGTNSWSWGLDDLDLAFLPSNLWHQVASPALRRLTSNLLAAMLAPRALGVDFAGAEGVTATYLEPAGSSTWLDGWTDADDGYLVGDFLDRGCDQILLFNRTPAGGRFMIASLQLGQAEVLMAEQWGASNWLDGWDAAEHLQLSGDFMGLGHDQVLFVNRTGGNGRALVVDFAPQTGGAQIHYIEHWGQSPWLDGIDGDGRLRLVGDFAGIGRDQVLFIQHG